MSIAGWHFGTDISDGPAGGAGDLLDLLGRLHPDWHEHAACRRESAATWFPERGADYRIAVRICETCPVRSECLEYALDHPTQLAGIWAGTTLRQRRPMRRARRALLREVIERSA